MKPPNLLQRSSPFAQAMVIVLVFTGFSVLWIGLTDPILGWVVQDHERLVRLSTYKGGIYIALAAMLLFGLVSVALQAAQRQANPKAPDRWSLHQILPLASLFGIAIAGTLLIGWGTYKFQQNNLEKDAFLELSSLAQMQRDSLDFWLGERLKDAEATAQDPLLQARVWGLDRRSQPPADLLKRIQSLKTIYGYLAVSILDPAGETLATTDATPPSPATWIEAEPPQAGISARMMWSLEAGDVGSKVLIACRVPFPVAPGGKASGSLLLHLDFETLLASLHQRQPVFHASSETFLGCRQGNRAIPLNRPRLIAGDQPNPNLAQKDLVGVQALMGGEGTYHGLDYRGVATMVAATKLKTLPWMVMTKMDRAEATAPLTKLAQIYTGTAILALATLILFLQAWWRKSRAHLQADQARSRAEKELLEQRLKVLSRHANDIVLLLDAQGGVLDANDRALEAYGYRYEQLCTLNVRDLRTLESSGDFSGQYEAVKREQSTRFETTHVRKDGSTFPVEVSARAFRQGDSLYVQSIVRDISERKKAEGQRAMTLEVLAILNQALNASEAAGLILQVIQRGVGVEAAAIRLGGGGDYAYAAHEGFPEAFVQAENCLRARSKQGEPLFDTEGNPLFECTCGLVLTGKTQPGNPLFTPGGSAWTNDSLPVLELPADQDPRLHPRNRCIHSGYRSIALIPIRSNQEIVGLLQLNDTRTDRFSSELIGFLEGIASTIGFALARKKAENALRESEANFRSLFETMAQGAFRQRADGTFLDINPAALGMFGLSREEFMTRTSESPAWDVIREDGTPLPGLEHPSMVALRTGEIVSAVVGIQNQTTGEYVWTEVSAVPEFAPGATSPHQVLVTLHDLTERKQSEAQHRLIERQFRIVADHTFDWESWHDAQGRFIYSSPSCERITGYRSDELMDLQAFIDLIHPEDRAVFILHLDHSSEHRCQDLQFRIRHKDGRIRWIGHTCRPILEDGRHLGIRASNRDITVQHLAQDWLRESEERLRRILEATHVGTWEWNIQTGEVRFNERWAEMIGYTLAELHPLSIKTWTDLLHPDDQSQGEAALRHHFSGENPYYEYECRMRHRAGHWIWVLDRGQVTEWTENGQPLVMSGTHTDITTRKQAEETLRANEAKLDIALRSARMGVWHWDIQANKRFSDEQTNQILGLNPNEKFAGATEDFLQRVLPEDREIVLQAQARSLEEDLPYECEYRITWPDGSIHFINSRGQVMRDDSGQPTHLFGVLWDISERKQAELDLQASEKQYSSLFNSLQEGFSLHEILTDEGGKPVDYRFLDVNPAFEAMTGIPRERWVGHTVKEVLPTTEAHWIETYGQVALTGEPLSFENHLAALDRWYQVHAFCPEPRRFAVLSIDVTAKRQAEAAMQESEARFQVLVEAAPEAIFVETRGKFAYVNRAARALFGAAEPGELLGTSILARVHPDSREIIQGKTLDFHTLSQNALENEIVMLRLDGTPVYVETSGVPLSFQGEPSALVFARDITAWKQSEAALSQERKLLDGIFNSVPGLVYLYDQNGRLIKWNKRHETLTGYTGTELAQMTLMNWYRDDEASQQAVNEAVQTTLATGYGEVEANLQTKDGRVIPMHFTASSLSIDGEPYFSGIGLDITDRKKAEAALAKLNEDLEQRVRERTAQLEDANKEMEAFSYSVSHDLRAPLRGIDGFSQALLEDYGHLLDSEGRHCLERVRHGTKQMGLLIGDLLELSRVGRSELIRRPLDLSALAQRILDGLAQQNPDRKVQVRVVPGLIARGDSGLVNIALENLLANAYKFTAKTPKAHIEFSETTLTGETVFFIRDNGAGFEMAYASKLFNAFQRLHSAADFEGTGIGLAIVQRILHRHGGRIWAEAEPGKGATFFFTLPE